MKKFLLLIFLIFSSDFIYAIGYVETAVYNHYQGWACKPNSEEVVGIHIYADGIYIGGGNAPNAREFAVAAACGTSSSSHGFDIQFTIPGNLLDGSLRQVRIYSIHADGSHAELNNSPVNVRFSNIPVKPIPSNEGDIVGRDLSYSWGGPLNYFGHIGIWDGANVIEAIEAVDGDDTLKLTPWAQFSNAPNLWENLTPVLDNYAQNYCRDILCNVNGSSAFAPWVLGSGTHTGGLRELAAKRAYLSYLIGASYTRLATYTSTKQGTRRYATETCNPFNTAACKPPLVTTKQTRGVYRCETFVMDSWAATGGTSSSAFISQSLYATFSPTPGRYQERWRRQIDYITSLARIRTPATVFNSFRYWNVP